MVQTAQRPRAETESDLIDVVRRGATLGAEIHGVDLSRPLDDATIEAIRAALVAHRMIFFRDQDITPAQQLDFGRRFGEVTTHPVVPHLEELPEIILLDNHADNPVFSTDCWHSDETFRAEPPMGSILRCVEIPPAGGDTLWADMCAVYEGLSDHMRSFLSGLEAVHDFANFRHKFDDLPPRQRHEKLADMEERYPNPTHPVVRTHPVSGEKALFVNPQFTIAIKGMRDDESRALLDFLSGLANIAEYQFRLRWEKHTIAFWDNASTQHYAANDYYPQRRAMHRVTIKGGRPV